MNLLKCSCAALVLLICVQSARAQSFDPVKLLKKDVGTWDAEIKMYEDPTKAPSVSKGTETNFMLGDYWLVSHFKGSFGGMDFEGSSQTGYDPTSKKFVGSWVDSMSPNPMKTEGTWDEKTQTLTSTGTGKDPTGNDMKTKMVVVYTKEGSRQFTMYALVGGQEMKMMEIVYTKAASKPTK